MAQGSIIWRCRICGNKSKGSCKHPRAGYSIVYRVENKQKWLSVGRSKKNAERRLNEIIGEVQQGSYKEIKKILFKDFAVKWLESYAAHHVKTLTLRSYRFLVRTYLKPAFGEKFLTGITAEHIQGFVTHCLRKRKISPRTTNYNLTVLKMMLSHAIKWGYLRENPADGVRKVRQEQKEMDFLQPDEIRRLLKHSEEPYSTLFMTAILTGMRLGEILGLKWEDIDWKNNLISVKRNLYWHNGEEQRESREGGKCSWEIVTPKSKRSIRNIIMSPRLKAALQTHRTQYKGGLHGLVFYRKDGEPLRSNLMIARHFKPVLDHAALKRIRFHDLRHTYTALLIAQGVHVKLIQVQLGHASVKTTLDRYGHLFPEAENRIGACLDEQISC